MADPGTTRRLGTRYWYLPLILFALLLIASRGLIWDAFIRPILFSGPAHARQVTCQQNLKAISAALGMYAQDADDHYPPADRWASVLRGVKREEFRCPEAKSAYSYALNAGMAGKSLNAITGFQRQVAVFEADARSMNAFGGKKLLPPSPRHSGHDSYIVADGHVESLPRSALLTW